MMSNRRPPLDAGGRAAYPAAHQSKEKAVPDDEMKKFQYPLLGKVPIDWFNDNTSGFMPLYKTIAMSEEVKYVKDKGWEYGEKALKRRPPFGVHRNL